MKTPSFESPSQTVGASIRTGLTADEIKQAFRDNLVCGMGRLEAVATKHDLYFALALTVRDRLFHRSVASMENYGGAGARYVAYLSAEFLLGPHLANNLLNLGITEAAREAMSGLGYDLDEILAQASAMAGWADSRRVTWTRSRRSKCPRSATASATSSAFSTKSSATAGSV